MSAFVRAQSAFLLVLICAACIAAQSQALDAQIEGIVFDADGAAISGAIVTATNVETGAVRSVTSRENGTYRFPILPLGKYSIVAQHPGFKRFERNGVVLSTGQTAVVDITLEIGPVVETVTVDSDTSVAELAKNEIGRLINSRDVRNLPLISRNPFNFIVLQPGVNGRTVADPTIVQLNVNGLRRRVGYQMDGNYASDADIAGFRLNLISEIYAKEVQLLSSDYSAEFGNTAGAIVNVITPSATNQFHGSANFWYRPSGLSAKPFNFRAGAPDPNIHSEGFAVTFGGPLIKDRWHLFGGYERAQRRSFSVINILPAHVNELVTAGLSPSIFVDRRGLTDPLPFIIVRSDAQITNHTRIAIRYNRFDGDRQNSGVGELNTTDRSFDLRSWDHALAGQVVTEISPTLLNEFRVQYAKRHSSRVANADTASGPSISISGRANFGRNPIVGGDETNNATIQFYDAFTKVFDSHLVKAGGGVNIIRNSPRQAVFSSYEFLSIAAYQDALSPGGNRRGYSSYQEAFGDPDVSYGATFLNLFAQDDWNATRRLKFNVGLRYDLYSSPAGEPSAPLAFSQSFRTDYNNFSPRLGAAYLIRAGDHPTVLRVGTGIYYDPPFLFAYRKAILNNGNSRFVSLSFSPRSEGAPEFPLRPTTGKRDIDGISPDFNTMYAVHSNVRLEQALTQDMSLTIGYLHTFARQMPVTRNINCRPTGAVLADGRPVYGTAEVLKAGAVLFTGCSNPIDPNYRRILMVESAGNLRYDGLILQLTKRFSSGYQFGANYTFSRARDDAPEDIAPGGLNALSDPSSRERDRGNSTGDVRHFLSFSMVASPRFKTGRRVFDNLANNNQLSLLAVADSGSNFNFTTGDINRDGASGDRPVGVPRNSGRLPASLNLDARYSRFVELRDDIKVEFFLEGSNVLNTKQVATYNGTNLAAIHVTNSPVNPLTGELRAPLPILGSDSANWRPSRQLQVGVKILF